MGTEQTPAQGHGQPPEAGGGMRPRPHLGSHLLVPTLGSHLRDRETGCLLSPALGLEVPTGSCVLGAEQPGDSSVVSAAT